MSESADLIAGRYRLIAQIGSGGMGVVWRARDELLGRTVALKGLTVPSAISLGRGDEDSRRAMREARIAARLHHANVIGIYDIVDHEGRPFLVMEYLASRSLSQLIASGELLPPARVARIGAQLAAALTAAHSAGIVHRDVKPGNVLLGDDGSVKLTDFGISRAVGDTTVTASGILLGTLGYIAPEVAQGQSSDTRSDVYALGATLYAAVEGHAPFGDSENAVALLYRIVHEELIPARHAGPLEPVLLWMLERDPALRPTMPQAQRALEAIEIADEPSSTAATEALPPVAPVPVPSAPVTPVPPDAAQPVQQSAPQPLPQSEPLPPADGAHGDPAPTRAAWQPEPRRSRRALAAVLIAAVVIGLGAWALVALLSKGTNSPGASANHATTSRSAAATSAKSSPSSHRATASSAPPLSPTPGPSASASAPARPGAPADPVSTIVDYYKLMPGRLDEAWNWMTPDYQQNHAGGRTGYDSFWSQIQRVTASDVTAQSPTSVVATIVYYYKDGSIVEERTQYGLVQQQGQWKIASSSVLSHQSR